MIAQGGVLLVFLLWALLIGGVGKIVRDRGRSLAVWTLSAAAAGVAAYVLGLAVFQQVADAESPDWLLLLSVLLPPVFMVVAMLGIGLYVYRAPVRISQSNEWKVHFVKQGEGSITIVGREVKLVWTDESRTLLLDDLQTVEADGECVRITLADELELAALPMGKPDTPTGRREQSKVLARRLRPPTGSTVLPTAIARRG